jgi:trans-aconitate methyltransferase
MAATDRKAHWDSIYTSTSDAGLSWYQRDPRLSLELIRSVAPTQGARIIDVGGGSSILAERLLDLNFAAIAVLDISETALSRAKACLGARANQIQWIAADVTEVTSLDPYDIWHDRAVFHFLTDPADRKKYADLARRTIPGGGHLIIATFAKDGPKHCSNLDVCRYDSESLAEEFGDAFSLVREEHETHEPPWHSSQPFLYCVFERASEGT